MIILISKPTTASKRNLIQLNRKKLNKTPFIKQKIKGLKKKSGRSKTGQIVAKSKGGGVKQRYRTINCVKNNDFKGIITSIEYAPNLTCDLAAVYDFFKHNYFYVIAAKNQKMGDIIKNGSIADHRLGHSLPLYKIPVGSFIYNIGLTKHKKNKIAKSAGCFGILIEKASTQAKIRLNSGKHIRINLSCTATLGIVSNHFHFLTTLGKAGRSRWLNKRPKVRGVAMNPVDHFNGGGEGKKSGLPLKNWKKTAKVK